jgi:fluoride exporter
MVATPLALSTTAWWWAAGAVGLGSALGALLRWRLAVAFNTVGGALPGLPWLPLGTLLANLLGGYLVGMAVAAFAQHPQWPQTWRLFAITGFLGGLTTFSTFSAETVALLQQARFLPALATAGLHLLGSLAATALGLWSWQWIKG